MMILRKYLRRKLYCNFLFFLTNMILQFLQIKKKMCLLFEGYTKCYNSLIPFGLFPNQIFLYLAHDIHTFFIDYTCLKKFQVST